MSKPAFDPSKPFEATKAEKPPFDPSKPFDEPKKDVPSPGASFANQAGNAGLLGYGPEIVASAAKKLAPLYEKITGDKVQEFLPSYTKIRDDEYKQLRRDDEVNPMASLAGKVVGTGVSLLPVGGTANAFVKGGAKLLPRMARAGAVGAGIGAVSNPGAEEGVINPTQIVERGKNAAVGFGSGAVLQGAGELLPKAIKGTGNWLRGKAEGLAESATGATRVQAEKFQEGAGRQLLDKKLVRFGDSPASISKRLESAINNAKGNVDTILSELDGAGVKISRDDLVGTLKKRLAEIQSDESQAGVAKKLEAIIENASSMPKLRPPSKVEQIKRGYQSQANYAKPNTTAAQKIAGKVYREAVENAAGEHSPSLAKGFKSEKALESLAIPVRDAAQKRALQLEQSPKGGLLDVTAAALGFAGGDPTFGVGTALARRVVAPRISSSLAVASDTLGRLLQKTPQVFGEYAEPLLKSRMAGAQQFQAQVLKLIRDPKFREVARLPIQEEIANKKQ